MVQPPMAEEAKGRQNEYLKFNNMIFCFQLLREIKGT